MYNSAERDALRGEARRAYEPIFREVLPESRQDLEIVLTKVIRGNGATEENMRAEEGIPELCRVLEGWLHARHGDVFAAIENARVEDKWRRLARWLLVVWQRWGRWQWRWA